MTAAEILQDLRDCGHDPTPIKDSLSSGSSSGVDLVFANFVSRLCQDLHRLAQTEENVNLIDSLDNLTMWIMELTSFLRELQCPHEKLLAGDPQNRLKPAADRVILLDFLVGELIAAKLVACKRASSMLSQDGGASPLVMDAMATLGMNPNSIDDNLCSAMANKIESSIEPTKRSRLITKPIFSGMKLNADQWKALSEVSLEFKEIQRQK